MGSEGASAAETEAAEMVVEETAVGPGAEKAGEATVEGAVGAAETEAGARVEDSEAGTAVGTAVGLGARSVEVDSEAGETEVAPAVAKVVGSEEDSEAS